MKIVRNYFWYVSVLLQSNADYSVSNHLLDIFSRNWHEGSYVKVQGHSLASLDMICSLTFVLWKRYWIYSFEKNQMFTDQTVKSSFCKHLSNYQMQLDKIKVIKELSIVGPDFITNYSWTV